MTESKPANWKPTKEDVEFAAEVIRAHQNPQGFLPQELFDAIPAVRGEIAIELAVFRIIEGDINVLLVKRDSNDPIWPGEPWYLPGTVKRGPETRDQALERLLNSEVKGNNLGQTHFAKEKELESRRANKETAIIYWAFGTGKPVVGEYFPVDNLPENIIEHHLELIQIARSAFIGD